MESSRSCSRFFLFCISILITLTGSHQSQYLSSNNHIPLFIFGGSQFDAGNNKYLKNVPEGANYFWPYGENFFKHPAGRFSDGRIIPDFIAEYLKLPLIPPYLQPNNHRFADGVNFASGGAGALVETHRGMAIDLNTQLSYFKEVHKQLRKKLGDLETETLVSKAIYLFSAGSSDYVATFTANSCSMMRSYSKKEYVKMVMGNITSVVKELYNNGGRKFGFVNLPPWDSIPLMKAFKQNSNDTTGCMDEVEVLVKLHNTAFPETLKELQVQLKELKYSVFDIHTSLSERANTPSKYGFKEGKAACCGTGPYRGIPSCGGQGAVKEFQVCDNPEEYVFFDSAHPSEKANKQFAELMWSGDSDMTKPCNLKALAENNDP